MVIFAAVAATQTITEPGDKDAPVCRILVIDDSPAIHVDFRKVLGAAQADPSAVSNIEAALFGDAPVMAPARASWEVTCALQGQEGAEVARAALLEGRPYSVAFVDMRMPPGWDGLKTVEELWKLDSNIQVVICSAYSDYDWVKLMERLGNSDKLLILKKPAEAVEILQCASALVCKWRNELSLRRHVDGLEKAITDRTERLQVANDQLRYLASHDALTGLPNRLVLDDRLSQAIAHGKRVCGSFAVLLIDLDRFKTINDTFGHRAGDEYLKEISRRIREQLREEDTLARLGGDEFVGVVNCADGAASAEAVAARMIGALQAPVELNGVEWQPAMSIGIAFYPRHGSTPQALLAHADAAMYLAKGEGSNNVRVYDPAVGPKVHDRVQLESDLRHAVSRGELELFYQPKADVCTGEVHSAEALIRWHHPERGLLAPDAFLPIAEECGLIAGIGEWVVFEACRQAKAWQTSEVGPIRVAVNLAPAQFRLVNLPDQIRRALVAANLSPEYLEIELTESAAMGDLAESAGILEAVSRLGVKVSIDDFGTGYTNMSHLRRLPIDKLKIDSAFIQRITAHPDDMAIVRAIVSVAHNLQLKVVAEGVETAEQLQVLKNIGCDQYQGFKFSPAVPAAEFAALMRAPAAQQERSEDDAAA
jgi:diguanylate cyclase